MLTTIPLPPSSRWRLSPPSAAPHTNTLHTETSPGITLHTETSRDHPTDQTSTNRVQTSTNLGPTSTSPDGEDSGPAMDLPSTRATDLLSSPATDLRFNPAMDLRSSLVTRGRLIPSLAMRVSLMPRLVRGT